MLAAGRPDRSPPRSYFALLEAIKPKRLSGERA
jgi:hypothetical protein